MDERSYMASWRWRTEEGAQRTQKSRIQLIFAKETSYSFSHLNSAVCLNSHQNGKEISKESLVEIDWDDLPETENFNPNQKELLLEPAQKLKG